MANPRDEFWDQDGGHLVFRETSGSTDGELLEVQVTYPPRSSLPPVHSHPSQEETFQIQSGLIRALFNGKEHVYHKGDVFVVPPGTHHQMHSNGEEPSTYIWQTRPAMKTEVFFETIWDLAQDGKANRGGVARLLQMIVIGQEYRDVFRLAKPPDIIQRILFAILAPIGKLAGYRGSCPKNSDAKGEQ
jgi:quercetin dioxygenase-like cupin family protein